MNMQHELDQRIQPWPLLRHPFYQAWESGSLPKAALADYAREYGAFIASLPQAWEVLGDEVTAKEEREHLGFWEDFAASLETTVSESGQPDLASESKRLFAGKATALGALYAFEVQQPVTAASKLDGLRRYYHLARQAEAYFEQHTHNEHEALKLLEQMMTLPAEEQGLALEACATMSQALWDALTEIYEPYCDN